MSPPRQILGLGRSSAPPLILAVLGFASVIGSLVQTMVLPLLPQFPQLLGVSMASASWIATSTMLVGAFGAPLLGWLGDRLGLKPMIIASLLILMLGAMISALAGNFAVMLFGRVLQGFAVGIVALSLALLRRLWHIDGLPVAVGIISGTIGIGTSLGVPLAGIIVAAWSWQAIFWFMAGSAALSALLALIFVPSVPPTSAKPFDGLGALGLALMLLLILVPASADGGLLSWPVMGCMALSVAIAAWWVRYQLASRAPFVDLRLFSVAAISVSHAVALLLGFAFFLSFTATITVSQMPAGAEAGLGGSVLLNGIVQMPASLVAIVAPALAGLVVSRWNPRLALVLGIGTALVAFALRAVNLTDAAAIAFSAMLVSGGISFAFAALPVALMVSTPLEATGSSNGVNLLSRQLGASVASVVGGGIVAASIGPLLPSDGSAFHWLFGLGGTACLLALVLVSLPNVFEPLKPRIVEQA